MKIHNKKVSVKMKRSFELFFGLALIVASAVIVTIVGAQETEAIPLIESASVPIYPIAALAARIEGKVVLEISTDGKQVSKVEVKSGPPMLVSDARGNIATWRFKSHKPTTFETTFQYRIVEPARCYYENGTATLKLPTLVEISVNGLQTCDPAATTHKILKR